MPIRVVTPLYAVEPTLEQDSHEAKSQEADQDSSEKDYTYESVKECSNEETNVSIENLDRTKTLLNPNPDWVPQTTQRQKERQERHRKKARSKKLEKPLSFEVPNPNPDKDSGKTIDEGGSVTIDRIDDPLKAVKIAMDNRVAMKEKLTETIAEYPCAIEEATRLQFHKKLVEHNQELLEGPPPTLVYKLPPFKATLEPI